LFDAGILSIHSTNKIDEPMSSIFKNGSKIHVETADFLCILKKDHKTKYRQEIFKKTEAAKWKQVGTQDPAYKHHLMFEVVKDPN
jgi:hypothetical protein